MEQSESRIRRRIIINQVIAWALRIEAVVLICVLFGGEFVFGYNIQTNDLIFSLFVSLFSLWLSRKLFNAAKYLRGVDATTKKRD